MFLKGAMTMVNFFKKKKQRQDEFNEEQIKKEQEDFIKEHRYKMENDPEYRKSVEESATFFKADSEARKAAGLENKIGSYTFICPNCGTKCKGSWHAMYGMNNLHGRTDCFTCNIHLMV